MAVKKDKQARKIHPMKIINKKYNSKIRKLLYHQVTPVKIKMWMFLTISGKNTLNISNKQKTKRQMISNKFLTQ